MLYKPSTQHSAGHLIMLSENVSQMEGGKNKARNGVGENVQGFLGRGSASINYGPKSVWRPGKQPGFHHGLPSPAPFQPTQLPVGRLFCMLSTQCSAAGVLGTNEGLFPCILPARGSTHYPTFPKAKEAARQPLV